MRQKENAGVSPEEKEKIWKIGIYIRLSREDMRCSDESESVDNQRAIIMDYIRKFDDGDEYVLTGEYVDDGISGTTDDERKGFQRMLEDIRKGTVNCVIVKDLARSFRNYSDQGYYLDDWFPRHNVRFISLFHQPLDSFRAPQNMRSIAVPIQGVLNENHCAETSDKVREVFDMKRRSGKHIGSFAVYGYVKDPDDRNALVVDREAASVVCTIFNLFLGGMSRGAIVRYLNDFGIPCPAVYKQEHLGLKYRNPGIEPGKRPLWCAASVSKILKNRMYCGDMVQGRYRMKSYKVHIQEAVPENEWYIVENTHEAIIDRDTFAKTQDLLRRNTRMGPGRKKLYLFSGFLKCGDCGRSMARSRAGSAVYYYCRTYKDYSRKACTKHTVRHECLEAAVLQAIRLRVYLEVDFEKLEERLERTQPEKGRFAAESFALKDREKELARISRYRQSLYQDWKDGEITREEYRTMKEEYEQKLKEIQRRIESLCAEQREAKEKNNREKTFIDDFVRHQNFDCLTRGLLIELVDRIEIHEGGSITIFFTFSDGISGEENSGEQMSRI